MVGSKKRKGWFLAIIFFSLVLTFFSSGYLFSQLHSSKDMSLPLDGLSSDDVNSLNKNPFGQGSTIAGPRRTRGKDKGKGKGKGKGKAKPGKTQPVPGGTEGEKGKPKDTTHEDESKTDHGLDGDHGSLLDLHRGGGEKLNGAKDSGKEIETSTEPEKRICDPEDLSNGQWVFTATPRPLFTPKSESSRDMSWTGYGESGCQSTIWNERYLLTPSSVNNTLGPTTSRLVISDRQSKQDWEYASRLKDYHWQLDQPVQSKQKAVIKEQHQQECRQPVMDVVDFIEVLKRAPLIMIGDRFLEEEYLALECMILGAQSQLAFDYKKEHPDDKLENYEINSKEYPLDYRIESEMPEVVELQVAPTRGRGKGGEDRGSGVYRKAKPGQMRLVDRLSNMTLATFIRSDVLWDSNMLQSQISKHALKSTAGLSKLEAGGLHPDCQLVGHVVLCEPANLQSREAEPTTEESKPALSSWWHWWVRADIPASAAPLDSVDQGDLEGEMSFGSDLDHDMINLEWTQLLREVLSEAHGQLVTGDDGEDIPRTPMVLVSNGHFWEYDPRDAMTGSELAQEQAHKRFSKTEQEQIRKRQVLRRKLLRQRYTMVLTNMMDYLQTTHPELRVMVQTSVKRRPCELLQQQNPRQQGPINAAEKTLRDLKDQEAALLNALTKTVVARMQHPRYSFLDTTFLRLFQDATTNKRYCRNFMMPGPLDILVHHLYGELFRLDL
ncbi:hypothetical protein BGZ83_010969 [Gryganskiella cystojenkinii]|nr:hypothetical protein BGZ83_010969 [Gryganskiella cystojenkinii]